MVDKEYRLPPYNDTTDGPEQNFALPHVYQDAPVKFNLKIMKKDCAGDAERKQKNKEAGITEYNEMNITDYPSSRNLSPSSTNPIPPLKP